MATLKQYETAVKKVNTSTGEARADAIREKRALAAALRKSAGGNHDKRRKLKFTMDEINSNQSPFK